MGDRGAWRAELAGTRGRGRLSGAGRAAPSPRGARAARRGFIGGREGEVPLRSGAREPGWPRPLDRLCWACTAACSGWPGGGRRRPGGRRTAPGSSRTSSERLGRCSGKTKAFICLQWALPHDEAGDFEIRRS
ncbi:LYR motif-containing protein 1 isoform X2 [Pipistrellus kuhlii]|uniref:LYR motif-containing protein 1 isoform X2 n=1 Tax=Pipistrellus kuhlii TaxID=59472 RepID=UPI001E26F77D|nr:LYR motif-containing protein 1 isoform X2 [Pipistrellus kuhlii]